MAENKLWETEQAFHLLFENTFYFWATLLIKIYLNWEQP